MKKMLAFYECGVYNVITNKTTVNVILKGGNQNYVKGTIKRSKRFLVS